MSEWLNWDEINARSKGKKIVFWGYSRPRIEKACKYLTSGFTQIVDSDPIVQKLPEVVAPEVLLLLAEAASELFIIITTTGFPDVVTYLKDLGFSEGKDFCVTPTLHDFEVLSRIQNHRQLIYFTCPDPGASRGGLYQLEIPSGNFKQLLSGQCHGLVKGKDRIYLVDDTSCGIRVLDKSLETTQIVSLPERARPHGIAYSTERDWIAVAFSGRDSIGVYNTSGVLVTEVALAPHRKDPSGLAEYHVNDLCIWKDHLYLTMFSASGNWKREIYDGAVLEYDLNNLSRPPIVLVSDLWLPHTPTVIRETLHFCESMEGKVWAGNRRLITEFHGFVRGIAHDGDFYYVGQSQHRFITRRKGATNISLDTGIFLVDDKTKATKFFPTRGLMDINSIMVLEL